MSDDREVTDELITAFNACDLTRAASLYDPRASYVCPGGLAEGREEITSYFALYHEAFPDVAVTVHDKGTCGDMVIFEWTLTSTHTGPLLLPSGVVAEPTGRRVVVRGCDVRTMENGLITSQRVYYDQLEMLSQLGVSCLAG
ncbi:ester cyclase [Sphaerisporangium dianthi]|uniref:Ester cyclase n=1 Tax=Sphaerisporangium dianthi TaxID=1436120 RepID=A0ABV9CNX6_9ACTN